MFAAGRFGPGPGLPHELSVPPSCRVSVLGVPMCDPESVGVHAARMEAFVWGSLLLMVPPGAPAEPVQP